MGKANRQASKPFFEEGESDNQERKGKCLDYLFVCLLAYCLGRTAAKNYWNKDAVLGRGGVKEKKKVTRNVFRNQ